MEKKRTTYYCKSAPAHRTSSLTRVFPFLSLPVSAEQAGNTTRNKELPAYGSDGPEAELETATGYWKEQLIPTLIALQNSPGTVPDLRGMLFKELSAEKNTKKIGNRSIWTTRLIT